MRWKGTTWGAGALLIVALAGCSDPEAGSAPGSGTVTAPPGVPESLLLDGDAEIIDVRRTSRVIVARAHVALSVEDTLARYRAVAEAEAADVLFEDYEGFEAELFLRRGGRLTQIRIRARADGTSEVSLGIHPE